MIIICAQHIDLNTHHDLHTVIIFFLMITLPNLKKYHTVK